MRERPNSEKDINELVDDINDGKAMPDMYFKRLIFESHDRMIRAESLLMANKFKNNNYDNPLDVYRFRSCILDLFRRIGEMCFQNKVFNLDPDISREYVPLKGVKNDYYLCLKLIKGQSLTSEQLIRCSAYLNFCLHKLNLTNLLRGAVSSDVDISYF